MRLDIQKNPLTIRMVKHWNRPREDVEFPSSEAFTNNLDKHLPGMV